MMGHIQFVTLPKTAPWKRFDRLIGLDEPSFALLAGALDEAAGDRLTELRSDPMLTNCLWLLVRLGSAARQPEFSEAMQRLGLDPRQMTSVIGFLVQVSARLRTDLDQHPDSSPFGEMASLALRQTLSDACSVKQPNLFDGTAFDIEQALREHSTSAQMGRLIGSFYGHFLERALLFYVDKVLPLHIGPGHGFRSITASEQFIADLSAYAFSLSGGLRTFGRGWFSRHHWESGGRISREEISAFNAHAIEKLQEAMTYEEARA